MGLHKSWDIASPGTVAFPSSALEQYLVMRHHRTKHCHLKKAHWRDFAPYSHIITPEFLNRKCVNYYFINKTCLRPLPKPQTNELRLAFLQELTHCL